MDFFQAQDEARRNSTRLIIFFALAVCSLIIMTNLLVMLLFSILAAPSLTGLNPGLASAHFNWPVFFWIGAVVAAIILGGSIYKTWALAGDGSAVAQSLGGRLIRQNTINLHERRALNVVEEMAIASGTPVPPIYLLEHEQGINAFAAGHTTGDAVIGITQGAITHLNREELQGVIAHEFSHILHGDMRLNMRLAGVLHGILLIGLIGYYLLRSARGSSSKSIGPILALGAGLAAIGYAGTFFGNLIKASVNRQREFLADASAVQFTRSKYGIAGALKKIGGYSFGSSLASPQAPSMSHAYFSNGISSRLQAVFATHPPLAVRIKRVDPRWDGTFPKVMLTAVEATPTATPPAVTINPAHVAAASLLVTQGTISQGAASQGAASQGAAPQSARSQDHIAQVFVGGAGQIKPAQLDYAIALINSIPPAVFEAVHDRHGACAVIYCLVMSTQTDIRDKQQQHLGAQGDAGMIAWVSGLLDTVQTLDIKFRLPLIDMALPLLRQLSAAQYTRFADNLIFLVKADKRIDLFEWSLQKIIFHHLDPIFKKSSTKVIAFGSLERAREPIQVLISMLIYGCVKDATLRQPARTAAEQILGLDKLALLPREQISLNILDEAVAQLARLKPLSKPRLLKACLAIITQDKHYSPDEMELMRALGDALDCPLPPWLG